MEAMQIRNPTVAGLEEAYSQPASVPQGCPFNTVSISRTMRPWACRMRTLKINARVLADDLAPTANGIHNAYRLEMAIEEANILLARVGTHSQASKSKLLGSTYTLRKELGKLTWLPAADAPHFRHAHETADQALMLKIPSKPQLNASLCILTYAH